MNLLAVTFCVTLFILETYSFDDTSIVLHKNETSSRRGKFWGIGVVRFENGICKASDSLSGTCYTKYQCKSSGGIATGRCAANIGVCCVYHATCGGIATYNNTYFSNPGYPESYAGGKTCKLTIQKCHPDICQIRIDFLSFSLAQPNGTGFCDRDGMYLRGGAGPVPVICGENGGQHVYLDFNGDQDIDLLMQTAADLAFARNWKMKIAQIGCDCPSRAPVGCLQYYNQTVGTVATFNYGQTISSNMNNNVPPMPGTRQMARTNYGICVAMQPGYCSITWAQVAGDPYSFTLTNSTIGSTGMGTVGTPTVGRNGTNCTTDFIVIPNPMVNGQPVAFDRFCGNGLPPVTTGSKPFVLTVVSDGEETFDNGNRGFNLMYTQNLCTDMLNCF